MPVHAFFRFVLFWRTIYNPFTFSPCSAGCQTPHNVSAPLRVPYSLIGRGTLCARQPITPTTLWGLNSPALQTLFSVCPSHQKTAGANRPGCPFLLISKAIPHNSKCRYGERGAAAAKPKAQIILDAAKVSAASGGSSEPKQGQRSQSARGFCPRSTMRVPQPDIIEHFGNADAVPQPPKRCLSRKAGIVRCCPNFHVYSTMRKLTLWSSSPETW